MSRIEGRWIILAAVIIIQVALARMLAAEVVDRIVAEVNDEIITMSELQHMAKVVEAQSGTKPKGGESKEIQRRMLEALIDRKLAKAEATRRGIKVSDKELSEALDRFKQGNNIPDDETLAKVLSREGLSFNEFKQQIADQIIQDRLLQMTVGPKVVISDADVRRVYDQRFKQGGTQLHLISVRLPFPPGATSEQKEEVKQKAETLAKAVQQGESLTAAARNLSLNITDMGFIAQRDLDPRLAEFLERLKPKEVAPVETPEGFQMLQLVGRRSGEARPFDEVSPQIRNMMMQREMEKHFSEWVKTLREKAHIKIML